MKKTTPHPAPASSLSSALAASAGAARVNQFAQSNGLEPSEVSADGVSLSILQVFDAMRRRGYTISEPVRPQAQPQLARGLVAWTVAIVVAGVSAKLVYYTPAPK